jgi:hypothetical protein
MFCQSQGVVLKQRLCRDVKIQGIELKYLNLNHAIEEYTNFICTKHATCILKNMIWKKITNVNKDEHEFF